MPVQEFNYDTPKDPKDPERSERVFWQDDLVNVSKFLYECLGVMLGADSDDQSQTSDQP